MDDIRPGGDDVAPEAGGTVSISETAVGVLLFGSGLAALIYQTTWLREFRLIFGVSTSASAAVLAIFMGGLGIGGLVIGKRADRNPNPLRLYANLEILVALFAAITPALTELIRIVYIGIGGSSTLGPLGANVVRLLLSAVVLGVPTFFMGGTLPAAVRAVEREGDTNRTRLARVYGLNTLGAVTGVLVSTFLLLELYGNRKTLWLGVLLNLLVAIVARSMSRGRIVEPEGDGTPQSRTDQTFPAPMQRRFVLIAAFMSGFAFFLMEIVWYRMLGPLLGGSTFTFGLILAIALLGIGIGGLGYSLVERDERITLAAFGMTAAVEAFFLALPLALGDGIAFVALLTQSLTALGFGGSILQWSLITATVVFLPAVVAGFQFPVLVALMGRGRSHVGSDVGLTYLANTAGAITGSLAGGFGLIPILGAVGTWRFVAVLLMVLAVAALLIDQPRRIWRRVALYLALASVPLVMAIGPTAAWRHSGIGAGRTGSYEETRTGLRDWANALRRSILFEADGIESSIAASNRNGISLLINGKSDGNSSGDAGTQIMGGLLGVFLHPEPRDVLIIGLGTGSSAGWAAAVEEVERVDVIELEPAVVEVAQLCSPVNAEALSREEVNLQFGDAREFVLTSENSYDVIFSEPSNPYRAGVAGLFTREFYESAAARLDEDGLFLQWIQGYEITAESVASVYATMGTVFPHIQTWASMPVDLLLVASKEPLDVDPERLRARLRESVFSEGFKYAWGVTDLEGVYAHLVAATPLTTLLGSEEDPQLSTDDHTPIEFGMARMVGRSAAVLPYSLVPLAARHDRLRPEGLALDWSLVERRRLSAQTFHGLRPFDDGALPTGLRRFHQAYVADDPKGVIEAWPADEEPSDLTEALILAWAHAEEGTPDAAARIDLLATVLPVEAELVRGILSNAVGDREGSVRHLTGGLLAARDYPWVPAFLLKRSIDLAATIGRETENPEVISRLMQAVSQPYATWLQESVRARALFNLASNPSLPRCGDAMMATLDSLEPHPPWDAAVLARRVECYEERDHPIQSLAREDLEQFFEQSAP